MFIVVETVNAQHLIVVLYFFVDGVGQEGLTCLLLRFNLLAGYLILLLGPISNRINFLVRIFDILVVYQIFNQPIVLVAAIHRLAVTLNIKLILFINLNFLLLSVILFVCSTLLGKQTLLL